MFMAFLAAKRDMFIIKSLIPLVIMVRDSDGFGKSSRHIHLGTNPGI
jgi:hypothetical protein